MKRSFLFFLTLVSVMTLARPAAKAEVLWHADHETGDISQWDHNAPWRSGPGLTEYQVTTERAHTGRYSLASSIDTGNGAAGLRWARRYMDDGSPLLPDEAYYSVWFYLPGSFDSSWWNFMQWKRSFLRNGRGGSDPVASVNFEERSDTGALYFSLNYKVGNDGRYKTAGWGNIAASAIDIPVNQWVHLECKYRWSTVDEGEISCWQDGQMIWSFDGIKTEFDYVGDDFPRQFAVNAYGSNISPSPYTLYIDDAAISSTRLGVDQAASFVNVQSIESTASPGSVLSIFGSGFTDGGRFSAQTVPLPVDLGGTSVTLGGFTAPLFAVWPQQIVVQVPWEAVASIDPDNGSAALSGAVHRGGFAEDFSVDLSWAAPSIFTVNGDDSGQAVALLANSSTFAAPEGTLQNARPATTGDVVVIYANGLGPVEPSIGSGQNSCDPDSVCAADFSNLSVRRTVVAPEVVVGGNSVPPQDILFAGLDPTYVGLYQVYFLIGSTAPTGDAVPLLLRVGDVESQPSVTIAIQ